MEDTNADNKALFLAIGLYPKVVDSTLKNKKVTQRLREVIDIAGVREGSKTVGNLLYGIATKMPETIYHHTKFLCQYVVDG